MSVLAVTDKFAPHAGGTSVVWTEWCRCWPSDALHVVTRQFPGWREFDRHQQYTITRVPYLDIPKLRMPLVWLRLLARTMGECRQRRPRLLHCGQILETGLWAPWLKRRFGVPYMVHTYGEEISTHGAHPHLVRCLKRVLIEASAVTTISAFSESLLRRVTGFEGPIVRVHPGVNTDRFVPGDGNGVRSRWGLGGGPLLVTVSRLMRRKGHDRMLQALPRIRQQCPTVRYVIAGAGTEEARLRKLVLETDLGDSVTFLGRVPDDELVSLIQSADVFVHPNRQLRNGDVEGFGIVFLEASACGVPVVAGNSGGAPEAVLDGVTGFLVDPNDVEQIADRVISLVKDRALRDRMGRAGREWARQFTWEAPAQTVWELSQQAMDGGVVRQ